MFIPSLNVLSKTDKKVHAYDVNALYPFVMANNDFPIGDPTYIEYPNNLILDKNTDIFGFFYCKVVTPDNILHPILQVKYNDRMVSGIGSFSGWFFSEELKNALNFGYQITIEKGYLFERANIFKGFVDDLYSMRTSYLKSDPRNYIAKILLNSLYGRFGMTDIFSNILFIEKKEFQD
jgi:DNA polymerase type B, organellar and viral